MSLQIQDMAHRPRRRLLQTLSVLREEGPGNNRADGIANVDDDDPDRQQNSGNNEE